LCYIGFIQSHDADRDVVDKFDDALHCVSQAFVAGGLPAQGKEKAKAKAGKKAATCLVFTVKKPASTLR
jgi:hypothetical protein